MIRTTIKTGTSDQVNQYIGSPGEIIFDTETNQLKMSDGNTAGGIITNGNMDYGSLDDFVPDEQSTSDSSNQ